MKKLRIAINGFGRIGRAFYKVARTRPELEVVVVNDLGSIENFAYLLKYDTAYGETRINTEKETGKHGLEVKVKEDRSALVINGAEVLYISEKDPVNLPWGKLGIDLVVESTGLFTSYEKAKVHLDAGAKRVVITAPMKEPSRINADINADKRGSEIGVNPRSNQRESASLGETVLMGINEEKLNTCKISSNASCTTNAGSPLLAILDEAIGIEKAILNTVHAYTASQSLVDGLSKKDFREGRAAAQNIVPSSTGAAIATTKAFTKFEGKFDGISIRVPIVVGSIVDITFIAKKETNVEAVNAALRGAAAAPRWKNIFTITDEPLVSSDIVGNPHASIADLSFTRVVGGNLVKVLAWYDNEMGYTHTLVAHVIKAGEQLK